MKEVSHLLNNQHGDGIVFFFWLYGTYRYESVPSVTSNIKACHLWRLATQLAAVEQATATRLKTD